MRHFWQIVFFNFPWAWWVASDQCGKPGLLNGQTALKRRSPAPSFHPSRVRSQWPTWIFLAKWCKYSAVIVASIPISSGFLVPPPPPAHVEMPMKQSRIFYSIVIVSMQPVAHSKIRPFAYVACGPLPSPASSPVNHCSTLSSLSFLNQNV